MSWKTRTLDELRAATPRYSSDRPYHVIHVNREEALLLCETGATVKSSGARVDPLQKFQEYEFEGRKYFWLAGYGDGDEYPVLGVIDPRLEATIRGMEGVDW